MEGSPANVSSLGSGNSQLSARQFVSPVSNEKTSFLPFDLELLYRSLCLPGRLQREKKSSIDDSTFSKEFSKETLQIKTSKKVD
jgi:hypothetical protein